MGVRGYIYMHNDREGCFEVSVNHIGLHDGLFTLGQLAERAMYPGPMVVYGLSSTKSMTY